MGNVKVYPLLLTYHFLLMYVVYAWDMGGNHHGWRQLILLCLLTICPRYLLIQPTVISNTTSDPLAATNWTIIYISSDTDWNYLVALFGLYYSEISDSNLPKINPLRINFIFQYFEPANDFKIIKYWINSIKIIIIQIIILPLIGESLENNFSIHHNPSIISMLSIAFP